MHCSGRKLVCLQLLTYKDVLCNYIWFSLPPLFTVTEKYVGDISSFPLSLPLPLPLFPPPPSPPCLSPYPSPFLPPLLFSTKSYFSPQGVTEVNHIAKTLIFLFSKYLILIEKRIATEILFTRND